MGNNKFKLGEKVVHLPTGDTMTIVGRTSAGYSLQYADAREWGTLKGVAAKRIQKIEGVAVETVEKRQIDPSSDLKGDSMYIRLTSKQKALIVNGAKRRNLSQSDYLVSLVQADAEKRREEGEYNHEMQREEIEVEESRRINQQLWEEEQRSERRCIEIWHEANQRKEQS